MAIHHASLDAKGGGDLFLGDTPETVSNENRPALWRKLQDRGAQACQPSRPIEKVRDIGSICRDFNCLGVESCEETRLEGGSATPIYSQIDSSLDQKGLYRARTIQRPRFSRQRYIKVVDDFRRLRR